MHRLHPLTSRRSGGLTVVEVTVVVAVVVVLVALLFPHLSSPRDNPQRQKANTVLRGAVNAINNYRQDYGCFPAVGKPRTTKEKFIFVGDVRAGCTASNAGLMDTLRAIPRGPNAGHVLNWRQVKYYEGHKATDPKNPREGFADGSEFPSAVQGQLFDPWGAQYCFVIETDDDQVLDLSTIYADMTGPMNEVRFPVVGFSLGKDGKLGGEGFEGRYRKEKSNQAPEDVVSWQ
jgi:type II secretory pathway pseudopilin PulG